MSHKLKRVPNTALSSAAPEETLTCIGQWTDDRDAAQTFLVATLDTGHLYRRTLEDRLRCFLIKQALDTV